MRVYQSFLKGEMNIPASKSHSLRAIVFASLAHGKSTIYHYLHSPDTDAMIKACQAFGAQIQVSENTLEIEGVAGKPFFKNTYIDAGNSGQVLRFIGAIAGLSSQEVVMTGDASIQMNRPVFALMDGLKQYGCQVKYLEANHFAPVQIKGPFQKSFARIDGQDSQPVSGLLIARAFQNDTTILEVLEPGETPWILLTLDWFKRLGIPFVNHDFGRYELKGGAQIKGFNFEVPGDFSSCAFPLVAALITQSEITLNHLDIDDVQGDKLIIEVLKNMGAEIEVIAEQKAIKVKPSPNLKGVTINCNPIIDAIPILAVLACFIKGTTLIHGGSIARKKESDRLHVMFTELKKLGADIEELPDGLKINSSVLHSGVVHSHHDHRVAMAFAIAGLGITEGIEIQADECIAKSFPQFKEKMQGLGAHID